MRVSTRSGTNALHLLTSCHVTAWSRCHRICWVGSSHSSHHPAKFLNLALRERDEIFLICHVSWFVTIKVSCDFVGGFSSSEVTTLLSLGSISLAKVEIYYFLFVAWPRDRSVAWLCWCDSFILIDCLAKFGGYGLCESGDMFFCLSRDDIIEVSSDFVDGFPLS